MAVSLRRRATSQPGLSRTTEGDRLVRRAWVTGGLALLVGVTSLTGCSASGTSSSGGAPPQADVPGAVDAGGRDGADPGADGDALTPVQERALISTGTDRGHRVAGERAHPPAGRTGLAHSAAGDDGRVGRPGHQDETRIT